MPDAAALAFLQNQWFADPAKARFMFDRCADDLGRRAALIKQFLFYRCLTGRRLRAAFGDLCDQIVWEEVSTKIGAESGAAFPADWKHMLRVLEYHQPHIVLGFGSIAVGSLRKMERMGAPWKLIVAPHPAARRDAESGLASAAAAYRLAVSHA